MYLLILLFSAFLWAVPPDKKETIINPPEKIIPPSKYNWGNLNVGGGGYVTGLVIHPKNKNIMYIRTDVGGAYRWDEPTKKWIQMLNWIGPKEANLIGVDGIALDPQLPDRVYLALGKNINGDGGIYRSEDRGKTWTKLMSANFEGNGRAARWIGECIAIDPLSSKIIYAGTRKNGLWRSTDDGHTWSKVQSIPDGFTGVHPTGVRSIVFDGDEKNNKKSSTLYVGIPGTGIYYSKDGGSSFSLIKDAPLNPSRLRVVNHELFVTHSSGVEFWSKEKWHDITPLQGKNYVGLAINPKENNNIVVAQRYSSFYNPIYRSKNKGDSWEQINTTSTPAKLHVNIPWWSDTRFSSATAAMAFSPEGTDELYYTDWFGVWRTPNVWASTTEWFTLEKGHEETVVLTLVAPPEGTLVYSGMADNFGFRHDSIDTYPQKKLYPINEGFSIAFCEKFPSQIAILGARSWGGSKTMLATSSDYGNTWEDKNLPPGATLGRIAISSTDPKQMVYIAGGGDVYYTKDKGNSWNKSVGAPQNAVKLTDIWNKDFSLASDLADNKFYIFKNGILYASADGGATWQAMNQIPIPGASGYLNVVSTPGKPGEVWVSLDKNGLWKTVDGGKSFVQIQPIGNARLFTWGAPAPNSTSPTAYCYGTINNQWGLYRSADMGNSWIRINDDAHQFASGVKTIAGDRKKFGRIFIGTGGCGILYGEPSE
jgi:photosystem II stability/assembly factor-like uncharacterized protein